jgi:hypothetical protein
VRDPSRVDPEHPWRWRIIALAGIALVLVVVPLLASVVGIGANAPPAVPSSHEPRLAHLPQRVQTLHTPWAVAFWLLHLWLAAAAVLWRRARSSRMPPLVPVSLVLAAVTICMGCAVLAWAAHRQVYLGGVTSW